MEHMNFGRHFRPKYSPYCVFGIVMVLSTLVFLSFNARYNALSKIRDIRYNLPSRINGDISLIQDTREYECHNSVNLRFEHFVELILRSKTIYKQFRGKQHDLLSWPNDIVAIFRIILNRYLLQFYGPVIRIIEVGSFKGKSAISMIKQCRELVGHTKHCLLIAVDTWLGAASYYEKNDTFALQRNKFGSSNLYDKFMNNVIYYKMTNSIVPLRLPSTEAAHVLHCFRVKADLIYIDAGHDYASVYNDLKMYYKIVVHNGYLFGDDYHLPDVHTAVNDFAEEFEAKVEEPEPRTWVIRKGRHLDRESRLVPAK